MLAKAANLKDGKENCVNMNMLARRLVILTFGK